MCFTIIYPFWLLLFLSLIFIFWRIGVLNCRGSGLYHCFIDRDFGIVLKVFFSYRKRLFPSFSFQKFCNFRFYNYVFKNLELFLYTLWATCWSSLLDECIDACAHMCINKCVCMESRGQSGVLFHRNYLMCMCMCIWKCIHTYVYTCLYVYVHTYRGQMRCCFFGTLHLLFEAGSLTGLEVTKQVRLSSHWAPWVNFSLTPFLLPLLE